MCLIDHFHAGVSLEPGAAGDDPDVRNDVGGRRAIRRRQLVRLRHPPRRLLLLQVSSSLFTLSCLFTLSKLISDCT